MSEPPVFPGNHDLSLIGHEHVRVYRETDGETGYLWNGAPILILTTTGLRTGQPRDTALIYGRDADRYLVIASTGGSPTHPAWYRNLVDQSDVEIQVKAEHVPVRATTAKDAEKSRLWKIMTDQWPNYDVYQSRTDRVIPLVVLTPR
jgi:deazaflavin-dependent oxidoreductase (nitroreductase family)